MHLWMTVWMSQTIHRRLETLDWLLVCTTITVAIFTLYVFKFQCIAQYVCTVLFLLTKLVSEVKISKATKISPKTFVSGQNMNTSKKICIFLFLPIQNKAKQKKKSLSSKPSPSGIFFHNKKTILIGCEGPDELPRWDRSGWSTVSRLLRIYCSRGQTATCSSSTATRRQTHEDTSIEKITQRKENTPTALLNLPLFCLHTAGIHPWVEAGSSHPLLSWQLKNNKYIT